MVKTTVLAVGLDPAFAKAFADLTPELIDQYIQAQVDPLREQGFEADSCLIDRGETAAVTLEAALARKPYDCVVVGAGLREPPEGLLLFERVINIVHRFAPTARIAFDTTPADTAEAAQRWVDA
jgi:hypothetical protein